MTDLTDHQVEMFKLRKDPWIGNVRAESAAFLFNLPCAIAPRRSNRNSSVQIVELRSRYVYGPVFDEVASSDCIVPAASESVSVTTDLVPDLVALIAVDTR